MALSAPRTISILSMLSRVRFEKSTAPPGGFMGVPSTSTLTKLEFPPLRKMEVVPPSAPVRPIEMPGANSSKSGSETVCRAAISSRLITVTGAVVCGARDGSACAVTTTLEERRSRSSRKLSVRDWPAARWEEHTSELQSQSNLVCRLLLEKKKEELFISVQR